jgi:integration host factor subunit beta
MIISELVERVAALRPQFYGRNFKRAVNAMLDEIVAALCRRDRVETRGFGVFSVRSRRTRIGRNPRNGANVAVEQKSIPFFKSGKEMRHRINRSDT